MLLVQFTAVNAVFVKLTGITSATLSRLSFRYVAVMSTGTRPAASASSTLGSDILIAREHKTDPADLAGLLTSGEFHVEEQHMIGRWRVRQKLLQTLR